MTEDLARMVEVAKEVRRVRTPDGADYYGQPVGTVITADLVRRAARQAARAGNVRGAGPRRQAARPEATQGRGKALNVPSSDRFSPNSLPLDPVQRKQTYQRAIRAARGDEEALKGVVLRLETDSVLDTRDYNDLLDQVEAAAQLPPRQPKKPAKQAQAKKPEAKKPEAPRLPSAEEAEEVVPPQRTGPNTRAAREREAAAQRAAARRSAVNRANRAKKQAEEMARIQEAEARRNNPPGLRQRVRSAIDQASGRQQTRESGFVARIANERNPEVLNRIRNEINNHPGLTPTEKQNLDDDVFRRLEEIKRAARIVKGDQVGAYQDDGHLFVGRVIRRFGENQSMVQVEGVGPNGLPIDRDFPATKMARMKPWNEIVVFRQQMAEGIDFLANNNDLDALDREIDKIKWLTVNEKNELHDKIAQRKKKLNNPNQPSDLPGPRLDGEAGAIQDKIRQARNDADLAAVVADIDEAADQDRIDPDTAHLLYGQVDDRKKQLKRNRKDLENLGLRAQADHFNGGGGIADAPEEGLWDYIRNDKSGRFTVTVNKSKGVSQNYWVTDNGKNPPERWMFKRTEITQQDILWENLAYEFLNRAGFPAPTTKWASGPDRGRESWMAQRHFLEETSCGEGRLMSSSEFLDDIQRDEWTDEMRLGQDPQVSSGLIIYDYLINNRADRYHEKVLAIDDGDGRKRIGIIDEGYAFGNADQWLRSPEWNRSLDSFYEGYRAKEWGIFSLALSISGSDEKLRQEFEEALEAFAAVDLEDVEAVLKARNLPVTDAEDLDDWLSELAWRRDNLMENMDTLMEIVADSVGRGD